MCHMLNALHVLVLKMSLRKAIFFELMMLSAMSASWVKTSYWPALSWWPVLGSPVFCWKSTHKLYSRGPCQTEVWSRAMLGMCFTFITREQPVRLNSWLWMAIPLAWLRSVMLVCVEPGDAYVHEREQSAAWSLIPAIPRFLRRLEYFLPAVDWVRQQSLTWSGALARSMMEKKPRHFWLCNWLVKSNFRTVIQMSRQLSDKGGLTEPSKFIR